MSSIDGYLQEIGTKLWDRGGSPGSGRAAIMVGSGFSRNAQPLTRISDSFPDWENVARVLVDKLYPRCSECDCDISSRNANSKNERCANRKKRIRYWEGARQTSGALRLAEMFEAVHGRAALHQALAAAIPNSQHVPSILHQRLVRLPWADIFTTNWDTLLEDAVDLYDRSYSIIHAPTQIATHSGPRIVKLHGSLGTGTRLIFTEDDFLAYRDEFAPFVSLVQQSMMENVFVLVGFSGEDPNFLHWLSWVRRQLGDYIQQVFLVDIHDVDGPETALLKKRGVTPLNIGALVGPALSKARNASERYQLALEAFFHELQRHRYVVRANLKWPEQKRSNESETKQARIKAWNDKLRDAPQWLALPHRNRRYLISSYSADLQDAVDYIKEGAKDDPATSAARNTNTGNERALLSRGEAAETVIELHEYAQLIHSQREIDALAHLLLELMGENQQSQSPLPALVRVSPDGRNADLPASAASILCTLVRHARLGRDEQLFGWATSWLTKLELSHEQSCWLAREQVCWQLGQSEPVGAMAGIEKLKPPSSSPRWSFRQAALYAELEANDAARGLLEDTVKRIRILHFEADKPHARIWKQSREAWAFLAYRALLQQDKALLDERRRTPDQRVLSVAEELEELDERLEELSGNLCDPRPEIDAAESELIAAAYQAALSLEESDSQKGAALASAAQTETSDPTTLDSVRAALGFVLLAEATGLSPRTARHSRICEPMPMMVTAAAILLRVREYHSLGWTLLLRSANPFDLDQPPLSIRTLLSWAQAPIDPVRLIDDLALRADRLVSALSNRNVPAAYCEGRLATVSALARLLAAVHPSCIARAFQISCDLHGRTALIQIPGIFGEVRKLFFELMEQPEFAQPEHLAKLFELSSPVRPGECWGMERWPDPFEFFVTRSNAADVNQPPVYAYALSAKGRQFIDRFAAEVLQAGEPYAVALAASHLSEPEVAPIKRRLALIEAARERGQSHHGSS